jgi:hypothetical protein
MRCSALQSSRARLMVIRIEISILFNLAMKILISDRCTETSETRRAVCHYQDIYIHFHFIKSPG